MSNISQDRRPNKTRRSLGQALFALMQVQNWSDITIQRLCDEADVARASFYAHFDSKLDLLDFLIAETFEQLIPSPDNEGEAHLAILGWLIDHITSSRPLFSRIASEPEAIPVLDRFKRNVSKHFEAALQQDGLKVNVTTSTFIIGGTFDALVHWSRRWQVKEIPLLRSDILSIAQKILKTNDKDGK